MGFLKNLMAIANQPLETKTVTFDRDWQESWEVLAREFSKTNKEFRVNVSFDNDLLAEICDAIDAHEAKPRIPYSDAQQPINNVGESFRQDEIAKFCENKPGEQMPWLAGFLMPEMANSHDKTAVAVYVIKPIKVMEDEEPFELLHAGYMDKESAQKVHKKLLTLMGKDSFIPLLIRLSGGTKEKPNYGVFPYAMTNAINFP